MRDGSVEHQRSVAVPEPFTIGLTGFGLVAFGFVARVNVLGDIGFRAGCDLYVARVRRGI